MKKRSLKEELAAEHEQEKKKIRDDAEKEKQKIQKNATAEIAQLEKKLKDAEEQSEELRSRLTSQALLEKQCSQAEEERKTAVQTLPIYKSAMQKWKDTAHRLRDIWLHSGGQVAMIQ